MSNNDGLVRATTCCANGSASTSRRMGLAKAKVSPSASTNDAVTTASITGGSIMIPFTKSVVPEVDLAAARIVAAPPAGLMPEPKKEKPVFKKSPKRKRNSE